MTTASFRYQAMIGVGGIGTGKFFLLENNHTLGREESRSGRYLDRRDYCKLHIISHNVKAIMGPSYNVIPVGKVGDDEEGHALYHEMQADGLDVRYVEFAPGEQTLVGFCFIYPDGTGGNLTMDDSACSRVDPAFVSKSEPEFAALAGRGVALAAPEVPMSARVRLFELASQYRFFRAASITSVEARSPDTAALLALTDLLAMNLDEAAALLGLPAENAEPLQVVESVIPHLSGLKEGMFISITAGKRGSWSWDGARLNHVPALPAEMVSTAGAGDAHISGIIAGLSAGLPLAQAQELGTLAASFKITSPHTINKGISRPALSAFASQLAPNLSDGVRQFLQAE